ncbi:MAG: O-antigen ligase family protein [Bryobacterales bacterium]|nr:O-antigen ligase family protein [Bryobacterales bacterium]
MPSQLALLVTIAGIIGFFYLGIRDKGRASIALWIPVIYVSILASRPVSMWFGISPTASADQLADGSELDRLTFLALQFAAFLVLIGRRKAVLALVRRNLPVLVFVGYCLASLAWSDAPFVGFKRWVKLAGDLMMVLIVVTDPNPLGALKRFLAWPGFILLPMSVVLIKYFPAIGRGYEFWTGTPFFRGISYNKNGLGAICLYWGLALIWLALVNWKRPRRSAASLLVPLLGIGMAGYLLLMARSATSMSCLAMGVIILVATQMRWVARRPVLIHTLVLAMIGTAYAALFLDIGSSALGVLERDSTLTGRTELWEKVLEIRENPFIGAGFESFWLGPRLQGLWSIFWWRPTQAHNGYIEVFLNLGWIGLGLLSWVILSAYGRAIAAVKAGQMWGGLMVAYTVVAIPYNFTEATFRVQNIPWLFLLLASVSLVGARKRMRTAAPVQPPRVGENASTALQPQQSR